jgi:hypothetical protein
VTVKLRGSTLPRGVKAEVGTPLNTRPNRARTEGRTCEAVGCKTVLSRYNPSDVCWAHTPVKYGGMRAPRRRPFGIVVDCSDVDEVAKRKRKGVA